MARPTSLTALILLAAVAVNLPVGAGVMWLACRLLKVGPDQTGVRYRRAFSLVVAIFLVRLAPAGGRAGKPRPLTSAPADRPGVLRPAASGRRRAAADPEVLARRCWWRTLGVFVAWRVLTLAHTGPTWLLVRPYVLGAAGRLIRPSSPLYPSRFSSTADFRPLLS
ncbi:MAG: hypothetical protein U0797_09215 [Gemmataceae bacterium]